ncbi:MAG: coproporphyrinogen III oxidase family protein [Treponema sp.]|jgi:oxygen-independent coproporphyrinogen-3 oxidase|nr:coproporphyrinogen III oxidase family protein [Treponema sp.]
MIAPKSCSLYLHIPFCRAKCDYCDFYSIPVHRIGRIGRIGRLHRIDGTARKSGWEREAGGYIETLLRAVEDLRARRAPLASVPSLYIGGGTPSLLGARGAAALLDGLAPILAAGTPAIAPEITVEANTDSAEEDFLAACRLRGVTRLSLGVQSFDALCRAGAGRRGTTEGLDRAARFWTESGGSLSLDLMTGLPAQTEDVVRRDAGKALALGASHISLYALTVEADTPLARRAETLPESEAAERLWFAGRSALIAAGLHQYEVSNFARSAADYCRHNIRYWRMENWLGAGPSASGTLIDDDTGTGLRLYYPDDLGVFLRGPVPLAEELDRLTLIKETLLMGYRYAEGPDEALFFRRFGKRLGETIPRTLAQWPDRGQRMLFLNRFLLDAFAELETDE